MPPVDLSTIGTGNESELHLALKLRYAGPGGQTEVPVAGFVADGLTASGEYIEVQIGSFALLKAKAAEITGLGALRIIHPVIVTKYIEVFDDAGKSLSRRKSPRRGSPWDLFYVLIRAPELALLPGVIIEIALVDVVERRVQDGKGSRRRKGVSITGRELTAWRESICLKRLADYRRFVPFKKTEEFTSAELGAKAGINTRLANKTLYTLIQMGVVERIGKKGRAWVYKRL